MFCSFTPHPASKVMRPAACFCSAFNRGMPCSAVGCWPDVSRRLQPRRMMSSSAVYGSRHTSKARWKVTDMPWAASISRSIKGMSTFPSAVRQPKTTPSAPSRCAISMSFSMMRCSKGEYRKSPPRGRIMTCKRVPVSTSRAKAMSPYEGVVPPSGMPAHSSTRSAPPACAAMQLSTPLAHTSKK